MTLVGHGTNGNANGGAPPVALVLPGAERAGRTKPGHSRSCCPSWSAAVSAMATGCWRVA